MGFGFDETRLWLDSLAPRDDDPHAGQRRALTAAYYGFRERAALVAAEIPQDLKEYTVHDLTHLDALWEMADHITGPEVSLTPTEAFVLGGAFLVHDLGMGLAAWPDGLEELQKEPSWPDILTSCVYRTTGTAPGEVDLAEASTDAIAMATEIALRERHAFQARKLAMTNWVSKGSGTIYHLIEEADLRQRYGELIGEIAASHWWDIEQVAQRFSGTEPIGAPVNCPDEWTVDQLKLACLMRVSDAAHLDERRAPGFLRALRSPNAYSDQHWAFQGYLQRPRRSEDRLVYTSARAFPVEDAHAWWVCFESLEMVDRELRSVDSLLVDRGKQRFAARGIRGIDNPARLAEYIRTADWSPVDARPRIDNVPALVRKLGGESLYGAKPLVALRELIQNARDASRALEHLLGEKSRPITVELAKNDESGWWLTVTDYGVGMSSMVLSHTLLDFGQSFWGSDLMRREFPGLGASRFESVGKFGVGFYSVFMLGEHVTVVSRRFDDASAQTKVLEFSHGVTSRPILRPASGAEIRHHGGTSVAVKLKSDPFGDDGLLLNEDGEPMSLRESCAYVAPAVDCDLHTREADGTWEQAVSANDWLTMPGIDLLRRICSYPDYRRTFARAEVTMNFVAEQLTVIECGGKPVARVALAPAPPAVADGDSIKSASSAVVIGGLRAGESFGGLAGVVIGTPTKADRLGYRIEHVGAPEWSAWADDQAERWAEVVRAAYARGGYTEMDSLTRLAIRLGGSPAAMPVGRTKDAVLGGGDFESWAAVQQSITALYGYEIDIQTDAEGGMQVWHSPTHKRMELDASMFIIDSGGRYGSWDAFGDPRPDKTYRRDFEDFGTKTSKGYYYAAQLEIEGFLMRRISEAWGMSLDEFLSHAVVGGSPRDSFQVGTDSDGEAVEVRYINFHAVRGTGSPST